MNEAWYLSRATGFTAYILLFAAVALGLAIRTRGLDRLVARWRVTDLHIFISLLALGFVILHAASLLWDTFFGYSLSQVLIPFTAPTRTLWTGVGIISAYLLLIVVVSFPLRRCTGYRLWRAIHYSTFGLYVLATAHGVFTGTDSTTAWAEVLYLVPASVVLILTLYRINRRSRLPATATPEDVRARALGWSAMAAVVAGVVLLAAGLGPFHWFGPSAGNGQVTAAAVTREPVDRGNFSDTFTGTVATNQTSGSEGQVSLRIDASGQRDARFDIELNVDTVNRRVTTTSATMTDNAGQPLCVGQLVALSNEGFRLECQGEGALAGNSIQVDASFSQLTDRSVEGTLTSSRVS
jgi:hypothetical protein